VNSSAITARQPEVPKRITTRSSLTLPASGTIIDCVSEPSVILVLCTASTEKEALQIAQTLVEREEAACVNVVPMIHSVYRWKGKISSETEQLLLIKTTQALLEDVKKTVKELHSYELPEIVSISVDDGDKNALAWIASVVKGGRENY